MKIIILANSPSGLISFRKEIIDALIKEKHDVLISVPDAPCTAELTELGATIIHTPMNRRGTNPLRDFLLLLKYIHIFKVYRPDTVLTYTIKPNIYGGLAAALCRIPQIANVTGLGTVLEGNSGILKSFVSSLYRLGLRKAKTVFFQNNSNLDYCTSNKIVTHEKAKLLPGSGVNLSKFNYLDYPVDPIIRFLYIGRLMKAKGTDELLEVAKSAKKEHKEIEFHIIGSYDDNYQKRINDYMGKGIVYYHGEQKDVKSFIKKCACVIHPSYHEGMSNVILEASACGRPIITTKVSGCQEAVVDGKTGILVNARDSKSLLNAVKTFLTLSLEQRREMGIAAREKMEREFDRRIVIKAYLREIAFVGEYRPGA